MDSQTPPSVMDRLQAAPEPMDLLEIFRKLQKHFSSGIVQKAVEVNEEIRDPFIVVASQKIDTICLYCRVEENFNFDFLQSITALDRGEHLELVYHLFSYATYQTLVLKTQVPRTKPELPSSVGVWPTANWHEREAYDLFGIHFVGHPDLRRLLLPEGWSGHPMLKDWKQDPFFNGMPTTRENPLDLLEEVP